MQHGKWVGGAGRRGSAIIGTLFFLLILSILLMGVGTYTVSHQTRADRDLNYARALDLAEAGINYEFQKISTAGSTPDDYRSNGASPPGGGPYSLGPGQFYVYCTTNTAGSPPPIWRPGGGNLTVVATGVVNGVRRTVTASCKGYTVQTDYAVYGINSVDLGSNSSIFGDVGSNGTITKGPSCDINGDVYLNGPNAVFQGAGSNVVRTPEPMVWPTVDQIAQQKFPSGGMPWLATHNDNASAVPAIVNNVINGDTRLVGPGNYYVTGIHLSGNDQITFDNTDGEVNLFVGPSGGSGSVSFRGTTDGVTNTMAGGHQVNVYIGTKGDATLDMRGNSTIRANIYTYNSDANGAQYGTAHLGGTPLIYGSVLAYNVDFNGTPDVVYVPGVQQPAPVGYYGFANSWAEVNGR